MEEEGKVDSHGKIHNGPFQIRITPAAEEMIQKLVPGLSSRPQIARRTRKIRATGSATVRAVEELLLQRSWRCRDSDHELHIWTERERRKKMRNMFSNLHALLPQLPPKADKSTIVDEAVNYIKTLQQSLQKLRKKKLDRLRGVVLSDPSSSSIVGFNTANIADPTREGFMAEQGKKWAAMSSPTALSIPHFPFCFQTWSTPNVVLSVAGDDAHISICCPKKPGLFTAALHVMEKHKLEVVSAQVSSDYFRSMYMIHARATRVSDQFPETLMIEEIYKLAVGEMILWIST
uniref:BHLH domain-containing protein n=1 Tax=Ananas comosus var. bracteatus TaxID=296719 RepID=A0A6V7QXA5_ANACO